MKKFLNSYKDAKALEIRADFRIGSELPDAPGCDIFVRADFLNLAGVVEPDEAYLTSLKNFCRHFDAKAIHSTYATFEHRGIYFFNPVPPILSPKLIAKAVTRFKKLQDTLGLPLAVRNCFELDYDLPAYIPEEDFFYEVTSRSGASFICDVQSSMGFAKHFHEDAAKHLGRLLEIDKARAFVRDQSEFNLLKSFDYVGPLMSFDEGLGQLDILCEGEFAE